MYSKTSLNGTTLSITPESFDQSTIDEASSQGIDLIAEASVAIDEEIARMNEEYNSKAVATLYSKPNCPYCVRAKKLLSDKGISINEVSAVDNRDELIRVVTEATGAAPRTVPQIWLNDSYIGGYNELDAHFKKSA